MHRRPLPVPGFRFSGIACGIKDQGALDLALIVADCACNMAAVFTQNLVQAAPVQLSRSHRQHGRARAILVNSGNANACTGEAGVDAALCSAQGLAAAIECPEHQVQIASTGVIGQPLPIERLLAGLQPALRQAGRDQAAADRFGDAICTTDRFPKGASATIDNHSISVFAKGAGMIAPNMATMLAYAVTDASVAADDLDALWTRCMAHSFNAVIVDGDTSTNDTAVILAGGQGDPLKGEALQRFETALLEACQVAAIQLVEDGEGARCVVEITVGSAPSDVDADHVARTIALSPLCKTAFFGADPNWGRIIAAAGRSGVVFDPEQASLCLSDTQGKKIPLFERGVPLIFDKSAAEGMMRAGRYNFSLELSAGSGQSRVWTCDLGHNYVTLNAEYTT
jgi:glutamate N-acetyltransferase/amino-acid N-acetyltransferase